VRPGGLFGLLQYPCGSWRIFCSGARFYGHLRARHERGVAGARARWSVRAVLIARNGLKNQPVRPGQWCSYCPRCCPVPWPLLFGAWWRRERFRKIFLKRSAAPQSRAPPQRWWARMGCARQETRANAGFRVLPASVQGKLRHAGRATRARTLRVSGKPTPLLTDYCSVP
jgi:hypothetical protein